MTIDWDELQKQTYESLKEVLGGEHAAFRTGGDDLRALSGRFVEFWKAEASGEAMTGNLLAAAEHHARALCVYYNVPDVRGRGVKLGKRMKDFALMGAALIRSLTSGGDTRGKEK